MDEINGMYVNISNSNPILSSQPNTSSVLAELIPRALFVLEQHPSEHSAVSSPRERRKLPTDNGTGSVEWITALMFDPEAHSLSRD